MKTFLKWTLNAVALLTGIVLITLFTDSFDKSRIGISILAIIIGGAFLGFVFYLIETKYIPWRKRKLIEKIVSLFNGKGVSDSLAEFKYGNVRFLVHIDFKLRMSRYGNNMEMISFHIPKNEIERYPVKPPFKYIDSDCNGIQTYKVYETNGWGLKLAKRRIENCIG